MSAAGIIVDENLVHSSRGCDSGSGVGGRGKLDVLLRHDEGVGGDAAAAAFAGGAVAG